MAWRIQQWFPKRIIRGTNYFACGYLLKPVAAFVLATLIAPLTGLPQGYNLKLGPLAFDLTGELGVTYDDNITASGVNPLQDFIFSVGLNFNSRWEVTRLNTLNVRLGVGYRKYMKHAELDSANNFLTVDPDTEISFEILAGEISIRVVDAISFSADPTDIRLPDDETLGDLVAYTRWNNRFSLEATWDINARTRAELSYSRSDEFPLEDDFSFLRSSTDAVDGQLSRRFSEDVRGGLWGQIQQTRYAENFQNDSRGGSAGVFVTWQVTDFTDISLRPGYTFRQFAEGGLSGDTSDFSGYNVNLVINNTPNRSYNHSLSLSQSVNAGIVSNFQQSHSIDYQFAYAGWRDADLTGGISWESVSDSGGQSPENFERWAFRLGARQAVGPRGNLRFNFQHIRKNSNLATRSYTRNSIGLIYAYDF